MTFMRWPLVITFLFLCVTLPAQAFDRRIGARPSGMGDAFLALADDINALNYNPAGLALIKNIQFSLEYANLYPGLDDGLIQENHLIYAQSLYERGGLGVAWNNRSLYGAYTENEFIFGYALRPVKNFPLWTGVTAKFFYLDYTDMQSREQNSYFINSHEKYLFGVDFGALYELVPEDEVTPDIRVGFSLFNINQPDLGLHHESRQPLELRVGTGVRFKEWDGAIDFVFVDSYFQIHGGVEKWFSNRRWGTRSGIIAGSGTGTTWTLGGSYAFDISEMKARLNYSFNYAFQGIQETAGIHRVSLDFMYSLPPSKETIARVKNYILEKINLYYSVSQKIRVMQQNSDPKYQARLSIVQRQMHEAVGQLIMHRNAIEFLRNLKQAVKKTKDIEADIRSDRLIRKLRN